MTAVRYRKIWIKFLIIIFLVVVGAAVAWYAWQAFAVRVQEPEELLEEEKPPAEEEVVKL